MRFSYWRVSESGPLRTELYTHPDELLDPEFLQDSLVSGDDELEEYSGAELKRAEVSVIPWD